MFSVMNIISNAKEAEILRLYLNNIGLSIVSGTPDYPGFTKILQYKPAGVIIEMPEQYLDQSYFLRMLVKNDKTRHIPVIGYGDHGDPSDISFFKNIGITTYFQRPLQTKAIIDEINKIAQGLGVSVAVHKDIVDDESENSITQKVLSKKTNPVEKMKLLVDHVGRLLAFPFTIAKVLQITQSSKTGAADLAQAIEVDPVVSSNLLKVANSVLFATRGKKISSVKDAIIRIGFTETKNIAMTLSVMKIFSQQEKSIGFNRVDFWRHSLATAVIAEKLARNAGYPLPETAFLAGLMRDFGIIILDEFFHEIFSLILDKTTERCACFMDQFFEETQVELTDVVGMLFEKWNLPSEIINAIQQTELSDPVTIEGAKFDKLLQYTTALADTLAKSLGVGADCDAFVTSVDNSVLVSLKYPNGFLKGFYEDIDSKINMFCQMMKLDTLQLKLLSDNHAQRRIGLVRDERILFDPVETHFHNTGIETENVTSAEELKTREERPDAIVMYAGETDTSESLSPFTTINNLHFDPDDPEKSNSYIPVMILSPFMNLSFSFSTESIVVQLQQSIDLRVIDFALKSMEMGKVIDYPPKISAAAEETLIKKSELEISLHTLENMTAETVVMEIKGAVHLSDIADLKRCFFEILDRDNSVLAIDFRHLDMMDSILIGLLANFYKKMKQSNSELFFIGVTGHTLETLDATGISRLIQIFKNETELANFLTGGSTKK